MSVELELETMNLAKAAWTEIDAALVGYDKKQSARDFVLGKVVLEVSRREIWRPAGFASFVNYFEIRVGWDPHTTMERKRVAERLEGLPRMAQELREGTLRWTAVREMTRKVNAETEKEWIEWSRDKNTHQITHRVRMARAGDLPSDPERPEGFRMRLGLDCTAEEWALFRRVIVHVRDCMPNGHELSDAACIAIALNGGIANMQLEMTLCPSCRSAGMRAGGDMIAVPSNAVEARAEGARVIKEDGTVARSRHIPKNVERAAKIRANHKCEVPFCRFRHHSHLHHLKLFSEGGEHSVDVLMNICNTHHMLHHNGLLLIEGSRHDGFVFKHPDGTILGRLPRYEVATAFANAYRALLEAGLKEGDVREALRIVRERGNALIEEQIVTEASRILTQPEDAGEADTVNEPVATYRLVPQGTAQSPLH